MRIEDIELKKLKREEEYLDEILSKEFNKKSKGMDQVEKEKLINDMKDFTDKFIDEYYVSEKDAMEYDLLEGIKMEIKDLELTNRVTKATINHYFLKIDDPNNTIEIDNIVRGKVAAKTAGKTGAKFGKFLGRKVKEGAVNLYNNKDEIFEKAVSSVQDKKNKTEAEYDRYKRRYSNYSADELKEIILDESNSTIKRRAAKDAYDEL
ncbi:hypothetical protein CD110_12155 [Staphylococcus casei]|uniref:hypothetical protein n=1 Tax=Staphylococcus casei TaxID=201828 RepID=UPI000CD01C97|nr:hypothetical protein [Staphylococcus casei]PNZ57304.1 hypothetical protein CD110_12155 [Staphylococcus casei]WJE87819.1 hypothetical protein QMO72_14070 [Staphylococcus casei]